MPGMSGKSVPEIEDILEEWAGDEAGKDVWWLDLKEHLSVMLRDLDFILHGVSSWVFWSVFQV